mmetsp:Transcript_29352/g.49544  ORF Transcript_29352/g.49544 Transcript_29352/m.49544 type:complete len:606 (-) Transcript_29352:167-1984(-)
MENRNDTCNSPSSLSTSSSASGDQTLDLGISLQQKGRQLSVESEKSLNQLEDLKQAYETLMTEAKDIEKNTDIDNYKAVSKAKNRLAQITGSIEKLQFNQLDAVSTVHLNSGKSKVRSHRRELNAALDELQEFTSSLHDKYDAVTQLESSVCSSSTSSISSGSDNDDDSVEVMQDVDATASPHTVSDLEVSDDEDEDIDFCEFDQEEDVSNEEKGNNVNDVEKASTSPGLQAQVRFVEPLELEEKEEEEEQKEKEEEQVVVDDEEEESEVEKHEEELTTSVLDEDQACDCLHCSLAAAKFLSPSWHNSVQALSQVKALAEATVAARPQPPQEVEVSKDLNSSLVQEEPVQKEPQDVASQEKKQEEAPPTGTSMPVYACECGHCRLAAAGWWTPQGVMHARALAQANAKAEAEAQPEAKKEVQSTIPSQEKKEEKKEQVKEQEVKEQHEEEKQQEEEKQHEEKQVKSCGCGHCHLAAAGFWTPQAVMHARALAQANANTKTKTEAATRAEAQKKANAQYRARQLLVQQAQEEERRRRLLQHQQQVALEQQRQRQYFAHQQRLQQERQYQQELLKRQWQQQQLQQQMFFHGHPRQHTPHRFLGLFGM